MIRRLAVPALLLLVAACAGSGEPTPAGAPSLGTSPRGAHLVQPTAPLQCVPYARARSGLAIRGDAWTWWPAAEGRYRRSREPRPGAVLVLRRSERLKHGHLAVVSGLVGPRRILVDQANWLNRGLIHKNLPVIDVSPDNDWSQVRVWYLPGNQLGTRTYPAHGFIHPDRAAAASGPGA